MVVQEFGVNLVLTPLEKILIRDAIKSQLEAIEKVNSRITTARLSSLLEQYSSLENKLQEK